MNADQSSVKSARTESKIIIAGFDWTDQLWRLANRRGKVSIGEERNSARCFESSAPDRISFAEIGCVGKQTRLDPCLIFKGFSRHCRRIVAGTVVNYNQFGRGISFLQIVERGVQRNSQSGRLVICRHDYRK